MIEGRLVSGPMTVIEKQLQRGFFAAAFQDLRTFVDVTALVGSGIRVTLTGGGSVADLGDGPFVHVAMEDPYVSWLATVPVAEYALRGIQDPGRVCGTCGEAITTLRWGWRPAGGDKFYHSACIGTEAPLMRLYGQVHCEKSRVDFVVERIDVPSKGIARVVVECDGHDFHERTKEQAKKDRSRDRFFAMHDLTVLRFTGSEIYADEVGCARQVYDFLDLLAKRRTEGRGD